MRPFPPGDRVAPLQPEPPSDRDPGRAAGAPLPVRAARPPRGPQGAGAGFPGVHGAPLPGGEMAQGVLAPRAPVPSEQLSPVPARLDAGRQLPGRGRAEGMGGEPVRSSPHVSRRADRGPPLARLRPLPRRADAGERPEQRRRVPVRPSLRIRPARAAAAPPRDLRVHALSRRPRPLGTACPRGPGEKPAPRAHEQPQLVHLPARARVAVRQPGPRGGSSGAEDLLPLRPASRDSPSRGGGVAGDRGGVRSDGASLLSAKGTSTPGAAGILGRAGAALFGVAVGDALGAATEFMTPAQIRSRYGVLRDIVGGGWLNLPAGQVTDDTEMTLCVARGIVRSGGGDLEPIANRFARWLSGDPADVGATCRRGIEEYMEKGRLEAPPDEKGAGNGAALRVAPVALYTLGDEGLLSRLAVEQAHITHHHPLSDAACVSVGTIIQRGLLGAPPSDVRAAAEELAALHPEFRFEGYDGESSGYVVDTLRTVFDAFFSTDSFEECVVKTVNRGGDADTTGSIAGAIAGARYGLDAIPPRWLRALDPNLREELSSLAEELVRMSPLFAGTSPR